MINEVSKPLSYHVPVEKICEKLKKKDSQICELKYGEEEERLSFSQVSITPAPQNTHQPHAVNI